MKRRRYRKKIRRHGGKLLPQKEDIILSERNNGDYSGWSVIFQFQKL